MAGAETWRQRARRLKLETRALLLAWRDPRVPWYVRAWVLLVAAYAMSPVDLIPDFIPVLGYLDDVVLLPLGILLAIRLVPPEVLAECRERAAKEPPGAGRAGRIAAAVVLGVWIFCAAAAVWLGVEFILLR